MDFAIVGQKLRKDDKYIPRVRRLLQRRRQTTVVAEADAKTINEFVTFLAANHAGAVQDILIGAHANAESDVVIQAFPALQPGSDGLYRTNFEILAETMPTPPAAPDPTKTIVVPPAALAPPPTGHVVRFRGCNLGKHEGALLQWKKALGNQMSVSAPRHFHTISEKNTKLTGRYGTWETMDFEFAVSSPTLVADTPALTALFVARQADPDPARRFKFTDGTEVSNLNWTPWLRRLYVKQAGKSRKLTYRLKTPVGKLKTIELKRVLKVEETGSSFVHEYPSRAAVPGSAPGLSDAQVHAARLAQLRADLAGHPAFQSAYGLPFHTRTDFPSVTAFIDGHVWTFSVTEVQKQNPTRTVFDLLSVGTRFLYTLMIPLSEANPGRPEPNTSPILTNYTPNTGTVPPQQLPEVDGPHFRIV